MDIYRREAVFCIFMLENNPKRAKKVIRFGIEFELFTLDEKGFMINGADRLIRRVRKEHPNINIKEECGGNMVEVVTPPHTEVPDAVLQAVLDLQNIIHCAEKEKLVLYAYGTYPGEFTPDFRAGDRYKTQQQIFGKSRFAIAGRCIGLHIHYSLPWGVFNKEKKSIKPLRNSENKEIMISMYNLAISMDPALSTFAQSSPFYQGSYKGKDARVIMYRGGAELDNPEGLYANYAEFGSLPRYESTNADLLHLIEDRAEKWKAVLKKLGLKATGFTKPGTELTANWSPVRLNQHGTIELRGMDMNHPDIVVAIAMLIKFIFKAVQERNIKVVVSDAGIEKPFKFDGTTITIPPSTYVRKELQKKAAYQGLDDEKILSYCSSLLGLAKNFIPAEKLVFMKPLEDMLRKRESASDRIMEIVKKHNTYGEKLSPAKAAELALDLASDLYTEIDIVEERLEKFLEETEGLERIRAN